MRHVIAIVFLAAVGVVVTFTMSRILPERILSGLGFIQFGACAFIFRKPLARLRRALYTRVGLNPSTRFLEIGGLSASAVGIVAGVVIFATAFV